MMHGADVSMKKKTSPCASLPRQHEEEEED